MEIDGQYRFQVNSLALFAESRRQACLAALMQRGEDEDGKERRQRLTAMLAAPRIRTCNPPWAPAALTGVPHQASHTSEGRKQAETWRPRRPWAGTLLPDGERQRVVRGVLPAWW